MVKRFVCVALAALLLCTAFTCMGESSSGMNARDYQAALRLIRLTPENRNAKLDAAFAADQLVLTKLPGPEIPAEDVEIPDAVWAVFGMEKPDDADTQLAESFSQLNIIPLSLSPSGTSGLYAASGTVLAGNAGKYRPLYPSATRGVADVNGNLSTVYQRLISLLGEEGVVYSPDARYAALCNIRMTLMMGQPFLDPILIDLSTGEMILTATYGNRSHEENYGVMTTAVFSADGRYFYYILYGNTTESQNALYRYDLESGETALCCTIPWLAYYPKLSETETGSLLVVEDIRQVAQAASIIELTESNGTWQMERHPFTLEVQSWYVRKMLYSRNSDYAFCLGDYGVQGLSTAFMAVQPGKEYASLNQYYGILRGTQEVVALDPDAYRAAMQACYSEETNRIDEARVPYEALQTAVLSPDGYYALLLTNARRMLLLSLDTMTCREVQGVDTSLIPAGSVALAVYPPVMEWNGDTLLILQGDQVESYSFAY